MLEEHGSERLKKVLSLSDFKGNRTLMFSEHFWSKKDHEWRMKKGVSLNTGNYRVMKEALDRENESIMDWLGVDYVPEDVARYTEIMELARLNEEFVIGQHTVLLHDDRRDPSFFRVEHKGGEDAISFNAAHPFKDAFSKADPNSQMLILDLIQTFSHTTQQLKGQLYYDPNMLFNHLDYDWSNYLKDKLGKRE